MINFYNGQLKLKNHQISKLSVNKQNFVFYNFQKKNFFSKKNRQN